MAPLVSILIPAYDAERWIADTIRSALAQTWPRKEIIVVDDGSNDRTLSITRQFASEQVSVVTQKNQGASTARNRALALSQGEFIQWLDADDILSPDKIAKQMNAWSRHNSRRTLLSSAWAYFYYRLDRANFIPNSLWSDLSPVEWLIRKMGQNLHMPPATWLVSRELTQAAGPWDRRLSLDDDGEYFCRVILASDAIRFVPDAKVFYRISGFGSLSNWDHSPRKLESQLMSMRSHVAYVRSLEDSERVRAACMNYLQIRFIHFYPEQLALIEQLQQLAASLGGQLQIPRLPWKYSMMRSVLGWTLTKRFRHCYNRWKAFLLRFFDRTLFYLQRASQDSSSSHYPGSSRVARARRLAPPTMAGR